jgi:hypothetical protein
VRLDLEQQFIKQFVRKEKQGRYLGFIENPKRRGTFLGMLYHGQDLNKQLFQSLRGIGMHESTAIRIKADLLKTNSKGYIISVNKELDGREMSLNEAIEKAVGQEGTVLLFGDGKGAYYEGEPPHNCYLSL